MAFPPATKDLYANAFSSALGVVTPEVSATLSVPVAISVDAMQTVFEAAVGRPVGEAVFGLAVNVVTEVAAAAQAVGGLGSFVSSGASSLGPALAEVTSALGGVLEMIPMVGSIVTAAISVQGAHEQAERERAERSAIEAARRCGQYMQNDRPDPTGPGHVTPADMFRDVADGTGSLGYGMPAAAALGYVLLCGGMTRGGVSLWPPGYTGDYAEQKYQQILADIRTRLGPGVGIASHTRRKMWVLIEGIMAARRPPTLERVEPLGDQGRALFPVLCDMLLYEYQIRRTWTPAFVQELFRARYGTCGEHLDLGRVFEASMMDWKNLVQPSGETDWLRVAAEHAEMKRQQQLAVMRGVVGIEAKKAVALVSDAKRKQAAAAAPPLSPLQGLAVGTGMLGLGYASWTAVRRFGPRAKRVRPQG